MYVLINLLICSRVYRSSDASFTQKNLRTAPDVPKRRRKWLNKKQNARKHCEHSSLDQRRLRAANHLQSEQKAAKSSYIAQYQQCRGNSYTSGETRIVCPEEMCKTPFSIMILLSQNILSSSLFFSFTAICFSFHLLHRPSTPIGSFLSLSL